MGNFLIRTALALPVHEVCHTANFCSPHPSRTFKACIVHDSERYSVIFLIPFYKGASVAVAQNSRNAIAELCSGPSPRSTVEKGAHCGG